MPLGLCFRGQGFLPHRLLFNRIHGGGPLRGTRRARRQEPQARAGGVLCSCADRLGLANPAAPPATWRDGTEHGVSPSANRCRDAQPFRFLVQLVETHAGGHQAKRRGLRAAATRSPWVHRACPQFASQN